MKKESKDWRNPSAVVKRLSILKHNHNLYENEIKKDDIIKDQYGNVYKVFSINGNNITAAPKRKTGGYGGPVNLHKTKVTKIVKEGVTGPTRMQIQKQYDILKKKYSTERQRINDLEDMFDIYNVKISSSGQVVSYKIAESIELDEKAKSEAQQQTAGAALAAKRGEIPVGDLTVASKRMYDDMSEEQLEDFAGTKHKGVPEKINDVFDAFRKRYARIIKLVEGK